MVSKPREHLIFIFIFFKRLSWTFFLWNRKNVWKLFFKWLWKSISSQCKMSRNFPLKGSEMLSSSKKRKKITRFEASLSVNDPKDNCKICTFYLQVRYRESTCSVFLVGPQYIFPSKVICKGSSRRTNCGFYIVYQFF